MSTFNLKKYSKKEDKKNQHTNKMLSEHHNKTPNSITEKQLKKDSVEECNHLTEKQLEKVRQDEQHKTIEGRLNANSETNFEIKHRNQSAYKGDINKVEEQRVSKKKQEDEKYEIASETKKDLRWWEKNKKDDHLVVANVKKAMHKIAQEINEDDEKNETNFSDTKSFDRLKGMWDEMEEGVSDKDTGNEFFGGKDETPTEDQDDEIELGASKDLFIADKRENLPKGLNPYTLYISVGYDPTAWDDKIDLENAVIDKVLEIRPDLDGKISSDDLGKPKAFGNREYMPVRLVGDEYMVSETGPEELFSEDSFEVTDAGGTPVQMGKISINMEEDEIDDETIAKDIADYVNDLHPELNLSPDAIDVNYSDMTATFVVGMGEGQGQIDKMPEDFPITEEPTEDFTEDFPVTEDPIVANSSKQIKLSQQDSNKKK